MKNTLSKLSLFCLSLFVLQMAPAMAQKNTPQTPSAQQSKQFTETSKRLGLSPEQEKKMRVIMKESQAEVKALKEANKNKPEEEKMKLLMAQFKKVDDKVVAILNEKQQVVWRDIVEERKAQFLKKREQYLKNKGTAEDNDLQGLL